MDVVFLRCCVPGLIQTVKNADKSHYDVLPQSPFLEPFATRNCLSYYALT